jgi:hypothetical protein
MDNADLVLFVNFVIISGFALFVIYLTLRREIFSFLVRKFGHKYRIGDMIENKNTGMIGKIEYIDSDGDVHIDNKRGGTYWCRRKNVRPYKVSWRKEMSEYGL